MRTRATTKEANRGVWVGGGLVCCGEDVHVFPGAKLSTQFGFSGGKLKRKGERKEPN
jgi:hypothetical protein